MRDAKLLNTLEIDIDAIRTDGRLRPFSETAVTSLIASIKEIGLQSEIHVRKVAHQDGILRLIAGGHRIEAFRRMKRQKIPCKVWDCTDDWAMLAEIDDNLAHTDLNPLDLAVFLAERKAVYERMYPETRAVSGAALAAKRWDATDNMAVASFVTSTADKMNQSERTIRRLVSAGQALDPEAISMLRSAPHRVTLADLQALAKCAPDDRPVICRELSLGKAKSAKEVLDRRKQPGTAAVDPVDKAHRKLYEAYARAPKDARRRFVRDFSEELQSFLAERVEAAGAVPFKARGRK
ncbi:ParB/RepB/Spo0J family partition protein [Roseobacter sp. YSTF-M11]|uniref:ParB/RepB/Spo0J family partition protein n=1 Tax=Roseobacter insulae TaxID=2859783 RepID=A0A9X1JYY5_9RHOB|nr:ParB/RepB/Spo0J family partition protein [Roseobacter insulae]MBW4708660.1 ParB/RepB/Spo0J family partition protein [Roseobacter insulae]